MRFAAFVLLLSLPFSASAVEITAGGLASPFGFTGGVGVEIGIGEKAGVEVRAGYLAYDFDVPDYHEEGTGPMAGVRARYYPQDTGNATRLWLGAGVSAASVETEWQENDGDVVVEDGEQSATLLLVELALGYKILVADERFVVDPQILLGYFTSPDSELDVFAGAGLSVGLRF